MKTRIDEFLALESGQRRTAHFALCTHALRQWQAYAATKNQIRYIESAVGTLQEVDRQLPADALQSARHSRDLADVKRRYQEPITAMQDDDLAFPRHIEFAYYAIYNLFRKYALAEAVDDWLIVNQALSSETENRQREVLLTSAIQESISNGREKSD